MYCLFFFFNDTATTEIYTLSLHDALPICGRHLTTEMTQTDVVLDRPALEGGDVFDFADVHWRRLAFGVDRKSTRLNSSHDQISYAVFCLKKKNIKVTRHIIHCDIMAH